MERKLVELKRVRNWALMGGNDGKVYPASVEFLDTHPVELLEGEGVPRRVMIDYDRIRLPRGIVDVQPYSFTQEDTVVKAVYVAKMNTWYVRR